MTFVELVRRRRDAIVACWMERARRSPSAQGLSQSELIDTLPLYLEELAGARASGNSAGSGTIVRHLGLRLCQGFSADEAAFEYALLARCLVSSWLDLGRPDEHDLDWVFARLEDAQAETRRQFTQHLLDDEQVEKRYLRLLDQVASESLAPTDAPLHSRVDELTDLIGQSLGADCGGLFLFDPPDRLRLAAACGQCVRLELDDSLPIGSVRFLHEISQLDEVTVAREGDGAGWLYEHGRHALFGRRLWSRQQLIGIVFLGLHDHPVGERAQRRLEVLGRRLALLLDNARLYEQARAALKDLEREREVRERFVSVLAHDLRSPLAAAKANAQLLLLSRDSPEGELRIAAKIIRSINRTDRMIEDLLDANRIRAGEKLPLRIDRCDLGAIAAEVVEEMRAVYGDRFELHTAPDVIGWWSARELKRSIWNLGSNAVKYGREETPIRITVAQVGDEACIAVHNAGIPLDEEQRRGIFEPFTRGRNVETTRGWGLGLTLVRGTAEAHGGRVDVLSDETGNTFRMVLPMDARTHEAAAAH